MNNRRYMFSPTGCLVITLGLGCEAKPYLREVERLIKTGGEVWTCERLKTIYQATLQLLNGNKERAVGVLREAHIGCWPDGSPKGPLGIPVRRLLRRPWGNNLKVMTSVLRVYTAFRLIRPIASQRQKAIDSIMGRQFHNGVAAHEAMEHGLSSLGTGHRKIVTAIARERAKKLYGKALPSYCRDIDYSKYHYLDPKVEPFLKGLFPSERRKRMSPRWMTRSVARTMLSAMYVGSIPDALAWSLTKGAQEVRQIQRRASGAYCTPGRVSILQEPGCKARIVAQPSAALQVAFAPLHSAMSELAKLLPESCMHNQAKGIRLARERMLKGQSVFSVDLSSATDAFPLHLQRKLLDRLGLQVYGQGLQEICDVPWDFHHQTKDLGLTRPERRKNPHWKQLQEMGFSKKLPSVVVYSVGQPMGLMGSFPLFHCSHIIFARGCCHGLDHIETFSDGTAFQVLGDDIIFADERVAQKYRTALSHAGVEVSEHKCFDNDVAQFAGVNLVRTRGQDGTVRVDVVHPYKCPTDRWVSNPISFAANLNKRLSKLKSCHKWLPSAHKDGLTPSQLGRTVRMNYDDVSCLPIDWVVHEDQHQLAATNDLLIGECTAPLMDCVRYAILGTNRGRKPKVRDVALRHLEGLQSFLTPGITDGRQARTNAAQCPDVVVDRVITRDPETQRESVKSTRFTEWYNSHIVDQSETPENPDADDCPGLFHGL